MPDFSACDSVLRRAHAEGRRSLYEHEVYEFLAAAGIGSPPRHAFVTPKDPEEIGLDSFPGSEIVLKIVHPEIVHKSDVGGVRFVTKGGARLGIRKMLPEFPGSSGVLAVSRISADVGLGRELLAGIRLSREFGPLMTLGLGGLDAELMAEELPPGRSTVTLSPELTSPEDSFQAFRTTLSYAKLTGQTRDRKSSTDEPHIRALLEGLHAVARHYSPLDPSAPFWITEFEVNPFLFSEQRAVPVDGLLKFEPAGLEKAVRPRPRLDCFLKPETVCLIGVSAKARNVGRIILGNLLRDRFPADRLSLIREDGRAVDGIRAFPSVSALPRRNDLTVVAIPAPDVPEAVEQLCREKKTQGILLITGGMGETEGGRGIERSIREILEKDRESGGTTRLLGGNSLGIVSRPGNLDTMFIPEEKLPHRPDLQMGKNVALVSQSGAFMITRMSRLSGFVARYAVSTGNEADLTLADFVGQVSSDPEIRTVACYIEGFKEGGGLEFAAAAAAAVKQGKDVIVYKAGRTPQGRTAASGHTASIAGDWRVAAEILNRTGCLVAHSFELWSDLLMLSSLAGDRKPTRNRLGALSNAGYETVGIADTIPPASGSLALAEFTQETKRKISEALQSHKLGGLQDVRNPMDLTPMADDAAHFDVLRAIHDDPGVDLVLHGCVPLTAAMKTLTPMESYAKLLIAQFGKALTKPIVTVVDSGELYDPLADVLFSGGIPVFRSMDRAVTALFHWLR